MNKTFEGKAGVKATVLADSINEAGNRFITFEVELWRGVLAELNTHRMLSKNTASSRAIPFDKMLKQLTGRPVRFGANQAGMQDKGEEHTSLIEHDNGVRIWNLTPEEAWACAKNDAVNNAQGFADAGFHKQISSRILEPFAMVKTIISGTEWANFFWLRDDDAADPSIRELARVMLEAKNASVPQLLKAGEYHLPYVDSERGVVYGKMHYFLPDDENGPLMLTLDEAIKVSCARCAAISFRNNDYGLQKSIEVYERLVGSERKHASALEHVATPMEVREYNDADMKWGTNHPHLPYTWENGVSHADKNGNLWSGNIMGFIQYRKTVQGENYEG